MPLSSHRESERLHHRLPHEHRAAATRCADSLLGRAITLGSVLSVLAEFSLRQGVASLAQTTVFTLFGAGLMRYVNGSWPWAGSPRRKRFYLGVLVLFPISWLLLAMISR